MAGRQQFGGDLRNPLGLTWEIVMVGSDEREVGYGVVASAASGLGSAVSKARMARSMLERTPLNRTMKHQGTSR